MLVRVEPLPWLSFEAQYGRISPGPLRPPYLSPLSGRESPGLFPDRRHLVPSTRMTSATPPTSPRGGLARRDHVPAPRRRPGGRDRQMGSARLRPRPRRGATAELADDGTRTDVERGQALAVAPLGPVAGFDSPIWRSGGVSHRAARGSSRPTASPSTGRSVAVHGVPRRQVRQPEPGPGGLRTKSFLDRAHGTAVTSSEGWSWENLRLEAGYQRLYFIPAPDCAATTTPTGPPPTISWFRHRRLAGAYVGASVLSETHCRGPRFGKLFP